VAATRARLAFTAIVLVFAYTTITNIIERPEGIKIAAFFIATIVATSFASRALRSTELRTSHVGLDHTAEAFVDELAAQGPVQVIANHRDRGDVEEYEREGVPSGRIITCRRTPRWSSSRSACRTPARSRAPCGSRA